MMSKVITKFSARSIATSFTCLLTINSALSASVENCTADAMLVFDASASMTGVGETRLSVPRIEEARDAVRRALPDITPFRRMGLIVYGPGSGGSCDNIDLRLLPISNAAAQIIAEVDGIEPGGGTPLTRGVQDAAKVLGRTGKAGVVVLVTDGAETCGGQTCDIASALAGTNVTVHVIGFRLPYDTLAFSDHTTYIENSELTATERKRLHTETRCLADRTGGEFVTADSTKELVLALQEVLVCPVVGSTHSPLKWS